MRASLKRDGWKGYAPPLPDLLVGCLRPGPGDFFDVDANTGIYSLIAAAARRDVTVHAFEPYPPVLEIFRRNVELNRHGSIRVIPRAVSDRRESARLYVPPPCGLVETSCSLDPNFKSVDPTLDVHVEVETEVLDDYWTSIGRPRVSVLKVDTEGTEERALGGACELVRTARPVVFYEFLHLGRQALFETLARGLDLVEVRLRPGEAIISDAVTFDHDAWNHAFVPREKLPEFRRVVHRCDVAVTDIRDRP